MYPAFYWFWFLPWSFWFWCSLFSQEKGGGSMTSKQADIHYIKAHWDDQRWVEQACFSISESLRVLEEAARNGTPHLAMNYMSIMDSYKRLESLINKMHRAPVGKYEVY